MLGGMSDPVDSLSPYSDVPPADQALYRERRAAALAVAADETDLHDPIQDDPALRSAFRRAGKLAAARLKESGIEGCMGACLALWSYEQDVLREEFGIVWFTPAQMNPETMFD